MSDQTRRRILSTARALGYRTNTAAAELAARRSSRLAVIVPYLDNPFFDVLLRRLRRHAADADHVLVAFVSDLEDSLEHTTVDDVLSMRPAGLLLPGTSMSEDELTALAEQVPGDFARVRDEIAVLNRSLRERVVSLDSSRGEVLDDVFRGVDRIEGSEGGRSFLGFHELLMDPESSARLDDDLETVLDRDFTARLPDADLRFLRRWRSTLAQESASVRRTMTGLSRSLNRFVRSRAFEEHRRLGAELAEAQRLAARLAAHTAPQTQLGIDLALTSVPMASIGSWRMRNPADTAVSEEIHGHEATRLDLEEVRRIVRASEIDLAELVDSVEAVLAERGAATVGEVLADRPATQGLASVVGLLLLARRRGQEVAGDEAVAWTTSGGRERSARIPRFLFTDRTEKSGDA